jgi:acyl-coenzyme A thioesterase PaaI-like protein
LLVATIRLPLPFDVKLPSRVSMTHAAPQHGLEICELRSYNWIVKSIGGRVAGVIPGLPHLRGAEAALVQTMTDSRAAFRLGGADEQRQATVLTGALRRFLDTVAAARADDALVAALGRDLDRWSARLERLAGSEEESLWRARPRDRPPAFTPDLSFSEDGRTLTGIVRFGRFHVGRGAVHGGAIGVVFDEMMGALAASAGRPLARTAYLHVDYRALTPLDRDLVVQAWFEEENGRKRLLRATLHDGDLLCAEAHGLWVELRPRSEGAARS